jgi:hypothetical protein
MDDHKKVAREQHAIMMADRFYRKYIMTIKVLVPCRYCPIFTEMTALDELKLEHVWECEECYYTR